MTMLYNLLWYNSIQEEWQDFYIVGDEDLRDITKTFDYLGMDFEVRQVDQVMYQVQFHDEYNDCLSECWFTEEEFQVEMPIIEHECEMPYEVFVYNKE